MQTLEFLYLLMPYLRFQIQLHPTEGENVVTTMTMNRDLLKDRDSMTTNSEDMAVSSKDGTEARGGVGWVFLVVRIIWMEA